MEENIEQYITHLDFDELFDENITLQTLIGNDSARAILQAWVDKFFNDRTSGIAVEHVPILLVGKFSTADVMARAISNSFGNLLLHTISAQFLNDPTVNISLHSFFSEGNDFSGYYIDAQKLNPNNQMQLFKILTEKWIWFYSIENQKWEKKEFRNRLIILSTANKEELSPLLLKYFKIKINLTPLSQNEIELALRQRLTLLNLKTSSDIPAKIAQCCPDDIGKAIEVLAMSHIMSKTRLDGDDVITDKHVNQALHILNLNNMLK